MLVRELKFAAKWQEALDASLDDLEAVAFKRAKEGDSQLITWLLRCHRPERYRDISRQEIAIGAPQVDRADFGQPTPPRSRNLLPG